MPKNKYLYYGLIFAGIVLSLFLLPILLRIFLPFILAFIIASTCQRIIRFLEKRVNINRGISSAIIVTIIVAIVLGFLAFIVSQAIFQIKSLLYTLPNTIETFEKKISIMSDKYYEIHNKLSPDISSYIDGLLTDLQYSFKNILKPITNNAINIAKNFAFSLPNIILFIAMFILSTFFFTKDYNLIINFIRDTFPNHFLDKLNYLKNTVFNAFFNYLKAEIILMTITFAITSVSLWIVGANYPIAMGILIGLVDVLPFLGTGIVLIPWSITMFLYGDYFMALSLLIIQGIAFFTRQLLEPRILSSQIGIHPILTLISIYIGLKFLGVIGVVIAPIGMILLVNLYIAVKSKQK